MPEAVAQLPDVMHVMAGVMRDPIGRVLLAQRPPGKHLAGLWEFPGGKLEPGESPLAALTRECREELGIELQQAEPLIRVPWQYGERTLLLDTWQIRQWQGTPQSLEGQALQWQQPARVDPAQLAPADRPILQALRLPSSYLITPADVPPEKCVHWFERIAQAIESGEQLLQLRLPLWPQEFVRELAVDLLPLARRHGAQLLLNGDVDGASESGVGVHLKSAQLLALSERPLPLKQIVGASCHDAVQLAHAVRIGVDFATLSPVAATGSHPHASPMGWPMFQSLAEAAALPVYALGGMDPAHIALARQNSGQGVAGIRGFWPL
jgi:8-oxo-dGTP diphosphatase